MALNEWRFFDNLLPKELRFVVISLTCAIVLLQLFRLLVVAHRYFFNSLPTSTYSWTIRLVDTYTLVLAYNFLLYHANVLTSVLAFIALADMLISVIRDPVLQIWHRTLLQVSLFTTRKAVPSTSPSFPKHLGWTLKLGRMIRWIIAALHHTETQSARRRELLLRVLLVFIFPILVFCEILTILSSAGFTKLCLALLPVTEAFLTTAPIPRGAAVLIGSISLIMQFGAMIVVLKIMPKLEGALINICRQRQLGNPSSQNIDSDKEFAILENNKFDLDSLIFGLNCPENENWGYKKKVKSHVSWVLDEKYRCTPVCEILEDQSREYPYNEKELIAMAQDLAANKIQLVRFNNDLGNDTNISITDVDQSEDREDSIRRDVDDMV